MISYKNLLFNGLDDSTHGRFINFSLHNDSLYGILKKREKWSIPVIHK